MAGLDRNKKRTNSSTSRVSRFSEALGAAQESSQKSGYPKTQSSKKSATQKSKTTKEGSETSGYPATQTATQQETQPSEQQATRSSTKSATRKSKTTQESNQKSGYPATQSSETVKESSETSGYSAIQSSEQQQTQKPTTAKKTPDKLAKRENPDYTQTTFRIPKKLSRQINRTLMDLADEGVEMDRSDLLEALTGGFIQLVNEVGAVEALEKFKNLGTQVDK
ncbi:MAG: hypothetical protein AAF630_06635 [Cyanobacteria bacterium P01_C01_bin.38]